MKKLLLALAIVLGISPALAQWQVPNGSIPVGRGSGVVGFNSAAPSTAGQCLISNGPGVAPSFQACALSGITSLANGGTNNALTASLGSLVYSDASKLVLLSAPASTGQCLLSTSTTAFNWGTCPSSSGLSGPSSVTGTSTTFTSGQCNINVTRSNSGAAMIDTLPGTGAGVLPAGCVVTITDADASALLVVSSASGAVINGTLTYNGFLYLGPGQSIQVQSNGTGYYPISVPVRARLGANTSIFISASGNDTTAHALTSGSAFATTNHAWAFAQSALDLNGFVLKLKHATGNYPQSIALNGVITGQNGAASVIVEGDTTTPANVTFPGAGGTVTSFAAEAGAQLTLQGVTLTSASGQAFVVGSASVVRFLTNNVGTSSGASLTAVRGGNLQIVGSYSITANQAVHFNANALGVIAVEATGVVITVTGSISQQFAFAQGGGVIFYDFAPSYSGTMTGTRWAIANCGQINTNGLSFPGSLSGALSGTCPFFN